MVFKKITPIILAIFFLVSCKKEYDNYLYETVSVNLSNAVNSGENPVLTNLDSIPKEFYAIQLEYTMNLTGEDGDYIINGESKFKNEYQVSSFNIYSLENFDTTHPSGESLNDYFLITNGNGLYTTRTIESVGYVGEGNFHGEWHVDSWNSEQYLILMHPPLNNGIYSFVVEIIQSNNKVLIDTTTIKLY